MVHTELVADRWSDYSDDYEEAQKRLKRDREQCAEEARREKARRESK